MMVRFGWKAWMAAAVALCAQGIGAQTLGALDWIEGGGTVARLSFNGNVRFVRQAPGPATGTDLWQVGVQVVSGPEAVTAQATEEGRRVAASAGRPAIELSYVPLTRVATKLITVRFSEKVSLVVRQGPDLRSIDFEVLPPGTDRNQKLPAMAESPSDRHFAVVLQSAVVVDPSQFPQFPRVPSEFQDYAVSTVSGTQGAQKTTDLIVGYFRTAAEAEQVRQRALSRFPQARVQSLDAPTEAAVAETPKSANVPVPAPAPAPAAPIAPVPAPAAPPAPVPAPAAPTAPVPTSVASPVPAPAPVPSSPLTQPERPVAAVTVEAAPPKPVASTVQPAAPASNDDVATKGAALLAQAREAIGRGRQQEAVERLNQALMLPPNPSSQDSQELIGQAWEQLGDASKARIEYELYLKLYPQSEGAQRVQKRLAAIGPARTSGAATAKSEQPKPAYSATGSISQYYYGGNTKTDSLVTIAAGIDQNTLTRTSQSVLVSSWDATGKYQSDETETKLVMRGAHSDNLATAVATTSATQGLISAAYVDYRDLKSRLDLRLGRQTAIGGSMFGLFDGVSLARPFGEGYKVSGMLGVPANQLVSAPQQAMAGVMVEADNIFERWGGNLSLMEQTTEGVSDRRAMGLEVRYFGDVVSLFSQLDYELNMQALNAFTMQGSVQGPADTTITLMVDDRKAPSLQLTDALISSGQTSLATLLQLKSLSEVQRMALDTAAQARQAMISLSRPLSANWQGSVDLRYSEIGALPAVGNFQAQPATGAQYNVSLQLTGSNLYSSRDINGFNLSYLTSDTLNGTQLAYNNLTGIWDNRASLEPSIRFYTQTDNTQTKVVRVSPGLRLSYKVSNRASVMGEAIYEQSQTDGLANHETSASMYFYVGYRYDFQ